MKGLLQGPSKEDGVAYAQGNPKYPQGFQQSILKGQVREQGRGMCDQFLQDSLIGDLEVTGRSTLSTPRCRKIWGPHTLSYQVVNFFPLAVILSI